MEEAPEIGEEFEAQGAASPPPSPASGSPPTHPAAAAGAGFRLTGNKRGRSPASSEAILGLREVAPPTDGSDCCCAICLQEFDADAKLRAMPCSHAFHEKCIFQWLRRSAACPLCRHQLPTEEVAAADDDEEELYEEQVRRLAIMREGFDRWHDLVDQQLQRIRLQTERLVHWTNLVEELQQMIRSHSSI